VDWADKVPFDIWADFLSWLVDRSKAAKLISPGKMLLQLLAGKGSNPAFNNSF